MQNQSIIDISLDNVIGLGVAGNFAHHLEQAGETADFVNVEVDEADAPKGIFPFYLPAGEHPYLTTYPLSHTTITAPSYEANLQMEPEVALLCALTYEDSKIIAMKPQYFTAYNDCSIRKEGAKKISEKKNWGINSKGYSQGFIKIDSFSRGGVMDDFSIASFLKRDGVIHEYGDDSPALGYSYFYEKLIEWMQNKLNTQENFGPLEPLSERLKTAKYPSHALISIGATAYTNFGESTFLQKGDEVYVAIYNHKQYSHDEIKNNLDSLQSSDTLSLLHQLIQ
jgi:hypothetical protein